MPLDLITTKRPFSEEEEEEEEERHHFPELKNRVK
jgi:hypothetical protein